MASTQLDLGLRCIKYLLCAVNSLFVLTGIMIISVGTTIYAVYDDFSRFLDPSYFSPATVLIVVGVLIFIISFFGCCGAIRESTCMVLVFAFSLSIVLIMELSAAIAAYALQGGIKGLLAEKMNTTIHEYETHSASAAAFDVLQYQLSCCGINGPKDWQGVLSNYTNNENVPESCCSSYFSSNKTGFTTEYDICIGLFEEGCIGRLSSIVHQSALYIGTGAIAIALIQITGIMFACMLGKAIRKQKTERERRRWEVRESFVNDYHRLGKTDPVLSYPVIYMQHPEAPLKGSGREGEK